MEQKAPLKMAEDYDLQNWFPILYVTDDYTYKESVELGDHIILDFDENDVPVAIEILEASEFLNIKKKILVKEFAEFKNGYPHRWWIYHNKR